MRETYRPRRLLRRPGAPKRLLPRPRPAHLWRRACALVMSAVLVFSLLPVYPAAAEPASRASSAESGGYFDLGERRLEQSQTLTDNGDGTYTWTLSVTAQLSGSDINVNSQVAQTGSFTAAQSGDYLLELWGGSGASGGASSYGAGGAGGEAGYVYGVVHLEAGQTLYYTLGGNGSQTTGTSAGGGANDGGSHGDWGSYTVGGGGGYSAVYLFDAGEYAEGSALTETQRLNNYILIAGGGGGGGAGDGFYLFGSQAGTADGGAGGSLEDSAAIPLTGSGYAVPGTVFAGSNGSSSGASTGYAGRGGSNVPGEVVSTVLSAVDVETPNDWAGTNNPNTPGGSGGAGNIRGGSGGAGFCGGSSSVAANVRYSLTDEERVALQGTHDSSTGGAVHITYLGAEGDQDREFDFTGTVSQYFDIEEVSSNAGTASIGGDGSFTVTGASLTGGETGSEITVTLTLRPRDGFAGGNGVPLFTGDGIVCATPGDGGEDLSATIPVEETCGAVNVPLDFTVEPIDHTANSPGSVSPSQLYNDNYAEVRAELQAGKADWRYDFIAAIGEYYVTDLSGKPANDPIEFERSETYLVCIDVTPKSGEAALVGETVESPTTISGAVNIILKTDALNENDIQFDKTQTYDPVTGTYDLALTTTAITGNKVLALENDNPGSYTFTVDVDGWYLIQLWGGDGGTGADYSTIVGTGQGGAGGSGGYVWGYSYLEKGTSITGDIGAKGENGAIIGTGISSAEGGDGGGYTSATWGNSTHLLAGGGGGGGGGGFSLGTEAGKPGDSALTFGAISEGLNTHNGQKGKDGGSWGGGGGAGGTAGANYRSDAMGSDYANDAGIPEAVRNELSALDPANNTQNPSTQNGGAIRITPLGMGEVPPDDLSNYNIGMILSPYFVLAEGESSVRVDGGTYDSFEVEQDTDMTNGRGDFVRVVGIDPDQLVEAPQEGPPGSTGEEEYYTLTAEFTVHFTLVPRAGFLGGNDVPVLHNEALSDLADNTGLYLAQTTTAEDGTTSAAGIWVPTIAQADYANVAIPDLAEAGFSVMPQDYRYYVPGDPAVQHSQLYTNYTEPPLDWQDDYVDITRPDDVTTGYQPSETTEVPIEVAADPQDDPRLATVGPTVTGQTLTETATIYVRYKVDYQLGGNLSHDHAADPDDSQGRFLAEPGEDFTVTLSAAEGYDLPENIKVTVEGAAGARYTYDHNTGVVSIPGDQVNGNIVITATAVEEEEEYTITYVYQTSPQDQEGTVAPVETYTEGAALSDTFGKTHKPVEYPGYDFIWTYYGDDGSFDITEMETMPAQDLIFVGTYVPQQYTLTIHYVDEGGQTLRDPTTQQVYFGGEYTVNAPEIPGYVPDQSAITGTMDTVGGKEITFTYTQIVGQLVILYQNKAGEEIEDRHTQDITTGQTYEVTSPEVPGYTADKPTVTGTATEADAQNGLTIHVTYTPNRYTVTFDPAGGTCATESRLVLYDSPYSYDPESKTYRGLPTAYREGYAFLGWYLADGTQVTEETLVATAEDHTLTARWSQESYTLTIRYVYSADDETNHGGEAHESYTQELPFGAAYHVPSPDIENYTPDQAVVSGTMPARDLTVTVTYTKNQPIEVYFHLRGGTWTDDSTTFWPETDDTSGATGRYAAYLTGDGWVPEPASDPNSPDGTHAFVGWTTVVPNSDTWNTFVDTNGDGSVDLAEFERHRYDFSTVHQADQDDPPIVLYAVWDPDVTTVEVVKVDSGTNAPLAGAGFTLYRYQQTVTANTETGGYEFQREKNQYGQYILEDTPVGTVTTDENGTARFANLAAGWYQLTETEAPAGYAPLSGAVVLFLPYGDGTPTIVTDESPPQVSKADSAEGVDLTVRVPNTVQYSAAITTPDSLTLTYTPPDLIWNPEKLEYEGLDGDEGSWTCEAVWPDGTGEGTAITVTNTSPEGTGPLTVTVTLDYEDDYISLLDLSTLTQTGEGSFQQTVEDEAEGTSTLTGTLAPGQAAAFTLTVSGTAQGLLPETAAPVGVITVRVTRQRRADAAGRGGPALPPLHPRRRGRRSKQG